MKNLKKYAKEIIEGINDGWEEKDVEDFLVKTMGYPPPPPPDPPPGGGNG